MITIDELISNELIDSDIANTLRLTCDVCNSELGVSDNLKHMECSNINCKCNVVGRFENMCAVNQIDITREDIIKIVNQFDLTSPYQLMLVPEAYKLHYITDKYIKNIADYVEQLIEISEYSYYFYEIVKMCGIPNIVDMAEQLCSSFNNSEEFFNELNRSNYAYISDIIGTSNTVSANVMHSFEQLEDELKFAETVLNLKESANKKIKVAFCDNLNPFTNKSEIIALIKSMFNIDIITSSIIDESVDILIIGSDYKSDRKYMIADRVNENNAARLINQGKLKLEDIGKEKNNKMKRVGEKIFIGTAYQFIEKLNILMN